MSFVTLTSIPSLKEMESLDGLYLACTLAVCPDEHSISGLTHTSTRDPLHPSSESTGLAGTLDRKPSVPDNNRAAN